MTATTDPLRERIMEFIKGKLEGMTPGQPVSDPYTTGFKYVQREPLTDDILTGKYVAYLFDATSTRTRATSICYCKLSCSIEIAAQVGSGENPNGVLNAVFCDIERLLMQDVTCGGLAYEIEFTKDEKVIGWRNDRSVDGVIHFIVSYRYGIQDPRSVV